MPYRVPLFIEREARIIWFLTFKQFIVIAVAGAICFFLFLTIGKTHFFLFIFFSAILLGGALAFTFLRIKGIALPTLLKDFFVFSTSSKRYLWKKKKAMPKIIKKGKPKKEVKKAPPLRVIKGGRLRKLSIKVQTER